MGLIPGRSGSCRWGKGAVDGLDSARGMLHTRRRQSIGRALRQAACRAHCCSTKLNPKETLATPHPDPHSKTCLYTSDSAREMTSSMPAHTASVSGSSPSPGVDSQTYRCG